MTARKPPHVPQTLPGASRGVVTKSLRTRSPSTEYRVLQSNDWQQPESRDGSAAVAPKRVLPKRREQSTVQLRNVVDHVQEQLNVFSPPEASSPSMRKNVSLRFPRVNPAPGASGEGETLDVVKDNVDGISPIVGAKIDQATLDQLEDLRLQNAVLRKSLAMLQQSVVESMKGGRAQFMGQGMFAKKTNPGGNATNDGYSSSVMKPIAAAAQDTDLEELRTSLAERRASLKEALEERDGALRESEAANREIGQLQRRNEELEGQLKDCQALLTVADAAHHRAEEAHRSACERAATLEREAAELEEQVKAHRQALEIAEAKAKSLLSELEAVKSARSAAELEMKTLEADLESLRKEASVDRRHLTTLADHRRALARRTLAAALGGRAWLRASFVSWAAYCADEREGRLRDRTRELEADTTRLASEANAALSEAENARASAEAHEKEAEDERRLVRETSERLEETRGQVSHWQVQAESGEARLKELASEVKRLEEKLEVDRNKAAEDLKAAEECRKRLEAELESLRNSSREVESQRDALANEASKGAKALSTEAAVKEASLREELTAAKTALAKAREAEAAATKQRDEARVRALDHEAQRKALASELESANSKATQLAKNAREANGRAEEAEKRIRDIQKVAEDLQKRLQSAEAREEANKNLGKEEAEANLAELQRKRSEAENLASKNAELTAEAASLRMALTEAKCDARMNTERAKKLGDERGELVRKLNEAKSAEADNERRNKEFQDQTKKFADEARQALDEAKQNIRIMVTAPKVAVNVGGQTVDMQTPFPFAAIRDTVQKEVMPKFARVFTVGEQANDTEIRKDVQEMVENLALTLQSRVCELMPQAEGTCNWDGFGAKCGGLVKR